MSLKSIVAALGGDLYDRGRRANVPAPGHSPADRSVSLLLAGERVVAHSFGSADWREVRAQLRRLGLVDRDGRLTLGRSSSPPPARPDPRIRGAAAARLWEEAGPVTLSNAAGRHLRLRSTAQGVGSTGLRFHPAAPISVYQPSVGGVRPALIARISDAEDRLTGVEVRYLAPNGRPAPGLRLSRKTVGRVPAGAAVRLAPAAGELLVAEGVLTTLSAMARFGLPGWALMAAGNLANWSPPRSTRVVLIAADRDAAGTAAAIRLSRRLADLGRQTQIVTPAPPFGDWNDVAAAEVGERKEEGS